MAKTYKEIEAISQIQYFSKSSLDRLYKENFINRIGQTTDTQRCYADIYAEYINNLPFIEIPQKERDNYKVKSHQNIEKIEIKDTGERERNIAKALVKKRYELKGIGIPFDFEIPLSQREDGVGKIDLVAKDDTNRIFYLIELKDDDSKESLLRAALEIFTYSKQLNEVQFKSEFILNEYTLKKCIILFKGTEPANMAERLKDLPNLKKFISDNQIDIFIFEKPKTDIKLEEIELKLFKAIKHSDNV